MILVFLDPEDVFLISIEILISIGLLIALLSAYRLRSRFPTLTSKGWREIIVGIACILIHGLFDILDTVKWEIEGAKDWLNLFDGVFFVVGLIFLGFGIWKVANYGAEAWEL